MPSALEAPVLQVDANVIHKVDTSNPQNLFSMWTVFARCADSVAQGRRLENLSWRLWTRETFCVEADSRMSSGVRSDSFSAAETMPTPADIPKRGHSSEEMPQLSGSVESIADEETDEPTNEAGAVEIVRPRIRRQDSCGSSRSRGRERHITSDDLEKMVASIVQEKEPLKAPLPEITSFMYMAPQTKPTVPSLPPQAPIEAAKPTTKPFSQPATEPFPEPTPEPTPVKEEPPVIDIAVLTRTEPIAVPAAKVSAAPAEEITILSTSSKTTMVIRGFSPSHAATLPKITAPAVSAEAEKQQQQTEEDAFPEPTSAPAAKLVPSKKATFALGGSSSCDDSLSDPSQSVDMRSASFSQRMKKAPLSTNNLAATTSAKHGDEVPGSLKSAMHSSHNLGAPKKQTSFSNQVVTQTIPHAAVFDDDSDSDDIDESAIDDDEDDSDWEDSNEDSGRSSVEDKNLFQRVDSKAHLTSRRSLITLMIQRSEHELKNGLTTSQSTMALSRPRVARQPPSLVASPNDSDDAALMMRHRTRPQSNLRPINEVPRSAAQPIMQQATGVPYQAAYSPRTNRRNMLSTELTESLRRHLLWERSQKTSTANAVLKRRHTSQDVANLKQYPDRSHMNKDGDNAGSWDQYLNRDAFNGYHAKGW